MNKRFQKNFHKMINIIEVSYLPNNELEESMIIDILEDSIDLKDINWDKLKSFDMFNLFRLNLVILSQIKDTEYKNQLCEFISKSKLSKRHTLKDNFFSDLIFSTYTAIVLLEKEFNTDSLLNCNWPLTIQFVVWNTIFFYDFKQVIRGDQDLLRYMLISNLKFKI